MKTILSILLFALPLMIYSQETRDPQNVLTVTGTAQVFASPDEAIERLGVQTQAPTAQAAQYQSSAIVQKLLDSLKGLDIGKQYIQTSRMSLSPMYNQP